MTVKEGDTFHAPLPPHNNPHLFIVISDPAQDSSKVVLVPLMTLDDDDDSQERTCILNAGDHPFIRHPSFVNFFCAKKPSAAVIVQRAKRGKSVTPELLARIREAAGKSLFLPLELRSILEQQGLVDPD